MNRVIPGLTRESSLKPSARGSKYPVFERLDTGLRRYDVYIICAPDQ
jgi:hypothetical protein